MSVVTSVSTVGSKNVPPSAWRLPPVTTLAPLATASAMCSSTFSTASMSISGPIVDARFEAVADLHRADCLGESLGEGVVDAVLHQDAVGADAGLAGVAVFRGDRALDRGIDIGVVEDDERRVAAQFQRRFFTVAAHCAISNLPISVEPVKVSLRTIGFEVISPPISVAEPGDDGEHALRHAGALGQFAQRQRRKRRLGRRLEHHRAAGGQRRAGLARDHRRREIPRRDRGAHADRLLDDDDALVGRGAGIVSP